MYYFCRQNLFENLGVFEIVGHTDVTGQYLWTAGNKFSDPIPKQTLIIDPAYGTEFPDFFDTSIPVMSQSLIDAFHKAGVDNFDAYQVTLKRKDSGEEFEGYYAVNFLGCVSAIDFEKTEYTTKRRGRKKFDGPIYVDDNKAHSFKAFRLSEGPSFLVVSDQVAQVLKSQNFRALLLQPTTDYDGD